MTDIWSDLKKKMAFHIENVFRCSWQLYRSQWISNIEILPHIIYTVTPFVGRII